MPPSATPIPLCVTHTAEFNKNERPSIGVAFSQKSVNVEHHSVKFEVWDTAGQERFRSVNSLYYRGAGAGVIVYDVTNRHSFENLQKHWLRELRENTSSDLVVAIVGNKCDLESSRRVTTEEAAKFAQENNFLFLETSAKTGKNVDAVFVAIARQALKQCSKNLEDGTDPPAAGTAPTSGRSSAGNGFTIVGVDRNPVRLDRQESTKSSGCC